MSPFWREPESRLDEDHLHDEARTDERLDAWVRRLAERRDEAIARNTLYGEDRRTVRHLPIRKEPDDLCA